MGAGMHHFTVACMNLNMNSSVYQYCLSAIANHVLDQRSIPAMTPANVCEVKTRLIYLLWKG